MSTPVSETEVLADIDHTALPPVDWSAQPLGKISDVDLGKLLGVSTSTVQMARSRRNIPIFDYIDWDAQPLGKIPDKDIAKALGVTKEAVHHARKIRGIEPSRKPIDWRAQPLGKVPDRVIAKKLNVCGSTVFNARKRFGIPSCPRSEIDRVGLHDLVGVLSDAEIAAKAGVTASVVRGYRCMHGIPNRIKNPNV